MGVDGLCGPSQCSTVAQPFPQRHVCHSLTRELGRAQISTAQPFLEEAGPGPDGCRLPLGWLAEADHSRFHSLLLFRLPPAISESRLSNLSPAALATQDSSHGRAIDYPTSPGCPCCSRWPARARFLERGLWVLQAPPRSPPLRAFSLLGGRRALALPGRSDPLSHLLFSLETKISWACPKLFQVCLLF